MNNYLSNAVARLRNNFATNPANDLPADNSYAARSVALGSAIALVIASAGFGATYAWSTGSQHGAILGALFVLFAVALECCKPLAFANALLAFGSFKLIRGVALTLLASVAIAYSLTAELGLMAGARGDIVAERATNANARRNAQERDKRAEQELSSLAPTWPAAELQATVDGLLQTPGADGCSTINGKVTRDVCPRVSDLRAEIARAQRRDSLEAAMRQAEQEMRSTPSVSAADPAASALVVYLSALGIVVDIDRLTEWLALVPVLAIEAGSALAGILVQAVSPPRRQRASAGPGDGVTDEAVVEGGAPPQPPAIIDEAEAREKVKAAILHQLAERGGSASASERGLAALIGTSRHTARRAIHGLVLAGIVAAEATRNGTMLRLVA